jgi:hypothetical protein
MRSTRCLVEWFGLVWVVGGMWQCVQGQQQLGQQLQELRAQHQVGRGRLLVGVWCVCAVLPWEHGRQQQHMRKGAAGFWLEWCVWGGGGCGAAMTVLPAAAVTMHERLCGGSWSGS